MKLLRVLFDKPNLNGGFPLLHCERALSHLQLRLVLRVGFSRYRVRYHLHCYFSGVFVCIKASRGTSLLFLPRHNDV